MSKDQQNVIDNQEDLTEVLRVRREKLSKLQEMGKNPFVQSRYDRTNYSMDIKNNFEEMEGKVVKIAGRIMSKRIQGKAIKVLIHVIHKPSRSLCRYTEEGHASVS